MISRRIPTILALAVAVLGPCPAAAAQVDTLVFDAVQRGLCWVEKPVSGSAAEVKGWRERALKGECPQQLKYDRNTDYFRANSVIRLLVGRGHFLSTYTAEVNSKNINDDLAVIRGVGDGGAQLAAESTESGAAKAAPPNVFDKGTGEEVQQWLNSLKNAYEQAERSIKGLTDDLIGPNSDNPVSPGSRLNQLIAFAEKKKRDTTGDQNGIPIAKDLSRFLRNTRDTDLLIEALKEFNKNPRLKDLAQALTDWDGYSKAVDTVSKNVSRLTGPQAASPVVAEIKRYLKDGDRYKALANQFEPPLGVSGKIQQLNNAVRDIFDHLNATYEISESPEPYEIMLLQSDKSVAADATIREIRNYTPYRFWEKLPATPKDGKAEGEADRMQDSADKSTAGSKKKDPDKPKPSDPKKKDDAAPPGQQESQGNGEDKPKGEFLTRFNFDVHRFVHANVVGGFVYSFLRTREYGVGQVRAVGNNGQPLFNKDSDVPTYNKAATIGPAKRPQIHYLVGVNVYLKSRDLFPGALKAKDYVIPGIMIGYGVQEQLNFFLGPNWELKPGVNLGFGVHFGREKFLAPGTVPYLPNQPAGSETRLKDDATEPPTVTRPRQHLYLSAGFDVSVFKSIWGKIAGLTK